MLQSSTSAAAPDTTASPSVNKSLLDKPLHLLTEDDIAQVTREDCRRYLKEKGMRRPSWNKSQAIQQVIMLKGLLESTNTAPDRDFNKRIKLNDDETQTQTVHKTAGDYVLEAGKDGEIPETSAGRFVVAAAENDSACIRNLGSTSVVPAGQMAIFYSGNVNVYEDIPADKAQEILRVAATPLDFSQEHPICGTMNFQPVSRLANAVTTSTSDHAIQWPHFQPAKKSDNPRVCGEETNMLREETLRKVAVECSSTREASVQRYLEKRKDRFKSTRK